ncbi:hypothetical protein OO012_08510 [Rhodobacteraceae bacterium KMM 6894]|nr:hypothetical protein [Rhodobacteraceae bacterium KMM 6894]
MDTVTFKPALLASPVTYRIAPTHVAQLNRTGGEDWRIDYADLTDLGHVTQRIARTRTERLDLYTKDGKRAISINASYRTGNDPQYLAFRSVLGQVSDAMNAARPDLTVTFGARGGARMAMFAIGVVILLFAVVFAGIVLSESGPSDRMVDVAAPLIAMLLFGGFISWTYRPGQTLPHLPIGVFAATIQQTKGKTS